MSRDVMLFNSSSTEKQAALMAWAKNRPGLHTLHHPDFHRLQIEKWIWDRREALGYIVMDVGQGDTPRRWFGDGYFTFGLYGCDVLGDLLDIPFGNSTLDGVVLTEVLEHCTDPFGAIAEVHRVLRPNGLLLVTSPFIWSWHGTSNYKDYWRFTHQAWELLLKEFSDVKIEPCEWTEEGAAFWDFLRRFECFGPASLTEARTAYIGEAIK